MGEASSPPPAAEEAAAAPVTGETEAERGQRIARQWVRDDSGGGGAGAAAGAGAGAADTPSAADALGAARLAEVGHPDSHAAVSTPPADTPSGGGDASGGADADASDGEEFENPADGEVAPSGGAGGGSLFSRLVGRATSWLARKDGVAAEAPALRAAHTRAAAKLAQLTTRRDELAKLASTDFGPDSVFLPLKGQCFELVQPSGGSSYTYSMCPFGSATQQPGGTSLGTWDGFVDGTDHSSWAFKGGAHCWNGPQRSLRVDATCGGDHKLIKVEEPNRCEYRASFETPAACAEAAAVAAEAAAAEADEAAAAVAAAAGGPQHTDL